MAEGYDWSALDKEEAALQSERITRQRQTTARARYETDPEYARVMSFRLSQLRSAYPHLTTGAALSLAKAGKGPDTPEAQELANRAAARKTKKGLGWHSIGDAIGSVGDFVAPVVRGGVLALQSAAEIPNAYFREMKAAEKGKGFGALGDVDYLRSILPIPGLNPNIGATLRQTSAAVAIDQARSGEGVDLGSGFFVGGTVAEEQTRRARASYEVAPGVAGTMGRILAVNVAEPGTAPFNALSGLVDATVAIKADPAAAALSKVGQANRARRSLVDADAGLLSWRTKTVHTSRAQDWLMGADGRKVAQELAENTDAVDIWKRYGEKFSPTLSKKLADAETVDDVDQVLADVLGTAVRDKPTAVRFPQVRRRIEGVRLFNDVPGTKIDVTDPDEAVRNFDLVLANGRVGPNERNSLVNKMMKAESPLDRRTVAFKGLNAIADQLVATGRYSPDAAREAVQGVQGTYDALRAYDVLENGVRTGGLRSVVIGETINDLPNPHMYSEFINRAIVLPDYREIRKMTSVLGSVRDNAAVDLGVSGLDWLQQSIWKPAQLLRAAWTTKVIGNEQLRIGSRFGGHPLDSIGWIIGRKGATDAAGMPFAAAADAAADYSKYTQSLSRIQGSIFDPTTKAKMRALGKAPVAPGSRGYVEAWADELSEMNSDDLMRRLAGGWSADEWATGEISGNYVEDLVRWMWEGDGKAIRMDLARNVKGAEDLADDAQALRRYVGSLNERLVRRTAGRPELLEAVRSGKFGEAAIRHAEDLSPTDEFLGHLGDLDTDGINSGWVKGTVFEPDKDVLSAKDKAVSTLFSTFMGRPTNFLSRSPAFRRFYWERIEELIPRMTTEAQALVIRGAREANLGGDTLTRMAKRATMGSGKLGFDDAGDVSKLTSDFIPGADTIAKSAGLDGTKALLYDLSKRSQFFDIARFMFPFGEAWKEEIQVWSKLFADRPQIVERLRMTVDGAKGAGYITEDDNGEQIFNFPGAALVTQGTFGVGGMGAPLKNLTMFGQNPLVPGLGPVAQIPLARIIPDKPSWDGVREALFPYGDPSAEGSIDVLLPAWAKKVRSALQGSDSDRLYASTVVNVMTYLLSTGEYDTDDPESMRKLEDAARKRAKWLLLFRAGAQFTLPSSPSPEFVAKDKNGDVLVVTKMQESYREMVQRNDGDYDAATIEFLNTYGDDARLAIQGRSADVDVTTSKAFDFVRDNPNFVRDFPEVYALLLPQGGEFDSDAYNWSLKSEGRTLTPREALERANSRIANVIFRTQRDKLPPSEKRTAAQQEYLDSLEAELKRRYTGWRSTFTVGKVEADIEDLGRAIEDPAVAGTEVAKAIRTYFAARDKANAARPKGTKSINTAKAARPQRDWLRSVALRLMERYPDFAHVYDELLRRELADDIEAAA